MQHKHIKRARDKRVNSFMWLTHSHYYSITRQMNIELPDTYIMSILKYLFSVQCPDRRPYYLLFLFFLFKFCSHKKVLLELRIKF